MIRPTVRSSFAGACLIALAAGSLAAGALAQTPAPVKKPDPTQEEVPLPALGGWNGTLVIDNDVGIWMTLAADILPGHGCPQIVGLDDKGRCIVLFSYSGKWTPVTTVNDGKWLGGFVHGDLDPRLDGPEIYTGSQNGNIWQVTTHPPLFCSSRLIAQIPGREIHTLVGGDLDPGNEGCELLAFTNPGGLYLLTPKSSGEGWVTQQLSELTGRIRDAVLLPAEGGKPREIATVGRHGRFETLTLNGGVPTWRTAHEAPMGMGRIALRPGAAVDSLIVYTVADDGRVWRHQRDAKRIWSTELIYVGEQGLRGCAAGRFDADPTVETVALFGYSKQVELLSKRGGSWQVETLFVDRDKGHWITRGEFDGRNGTDELVATGYSGRVVLLARPPGYGLPGVLATPDQR